MAISVNGPTSMRIDEICKALNVEVLELKLVKQMLFQKQKVKQWIYSKNNGEALMEETLHTLQK